MAESPVRGGRAVRSFLALGAGNYGAMALGLIVNVLLARRLGSAQYGRLALMLMASQVLALVAANWSHAGFVRFGAQEFAANGHLTVAFWTRLGILLPAAALAVGGVLVMGRPLATYLGIPEVGVWLLLVHFMAASTLSVVGAVFQASDQMARYGVCLLLDKATMLLCIGALPPAWTRSPLAILGCYAASSLSVAIWGISRSRVHLRENVLPTRSSYREMLLFSAPLLLSSWAGFFGTNWFDLVILKQYVPMSELGLYSLATQLAGVVQQITVIFSTLLLPHLSVMVAQRQDQRILIYLRRLLPYWLLGTSLLLSVIVVAGRHGIALVFGGSFAGAAPVLALLMLATSALALFNACAPLVTAYGSTWALTGIGLLSASANVVLDLLLIPRFGIEGSAVATTLAYGVSAVLVLLLLQFRLRTGLFQFAFAGAPVLAASLCFLLVDGGWFYVAAPATAAASVVALVRAFGLFQRKDEMFLRELRQSMPFRLGAGVSAGK
jgi:O-antigen/teichoic acid export membrane protein